MCPIIEAPKPGKGGAALIRFLKKYRRWLLCLLAVILVSIGLLRREACIEYDMMSCKEKLKFHIETELQVFSSSIFESIEIGRPRYSREVREWTFIVQLRGEPQPRYYKYIPRNRVFIQIA